MRTRTKRISAPIESGIWGTFFSKDESGNVIDIKILVPEIIDELTLLVNIHEYAHAIMDAIFHNDDKLREHDHKLYKYREESLANAFALKVLEMSIENTLITKSGFDKIKGFVDKQDEEYRHGLDLYNDLYESKDLLKMMEFWREMKIEGNKRF